MVLFSVIEKFSIISQIVLLINGCQFIDEIYYLVSNLFKQIKRFGHLNVLLLKKVKRDD